MMGDWNGKLRDDLLLGRGIGNYRMRDTNENEERFVLSAEKNNFKVANTFFLRRKTVGNGLGGRPKEA